MKILAIGCSFTFGSELPDLPPGPLIDKPPSQLAFPSQLGRMIDNAKQFEKQLLPIFKR